MGAFRVRDFAPLQTAMEFRCPAKKTFLAAECLLHAIQGESTGQLYRLVIEMSVRPGAIVLRIAVPIEHGERDVDFLDWKNALDAVVEQAAGADEVAA